MTAMFEKAGSEGFRLSLGALPAGLSHSMLIPVVQQGTRACG